MSQSPMPAKPILENTISYPPYLFNTPEEKKLYNRLRDVYTKHYHTWDAEACDMWPVIVEHASLAPSTINKTTNHSITRHMIIHGVTWAHVTALRIIYKEKLYKSRKIMHLIRAKYPRANFNSFAYHEAYKLPIKVEYTEEVQEPTVQRFTTVGGDAHHFQGGRDPLLTEAPPINEPEGRRGINSFLYEENYSEGEEAVWPYSMKKGLLAAHVNTGGEEAKRRSERKQHIELPGPNTDRPLVESSSRRQRQAAPRTRQDEGEAGPVDSGRKRKFAQYHAAIDTSRPSPRPNEAPDSSKVDLDGFKTILERLMSAVTENTKATKENTKELKNLFRGKQ
ncbi:hypothetical protein ACHAQJ_003790 [Trichoderma viride]